MADPLSIGASVLAFVGLAEKVIRMSKHCMDAVKDAPSDMQMILGEVSSVKAVVEGCRDAENSAQSLVARLFAPSGPIDACMRCLGGLEALLPPGIGSDAAGKKRKLTLIELAWPLKQSKARKLLAEISHYKASILLAISGDMNHDIKGIQTGLQKVLQSTSGSESREVYKWLERRNPSTLHNGASKKHEPHTSAWLLRTSEWQRWLSSSPDSRFLWLYGLPGSGKTVLASFAIEHLKTLRRQSPGSCLAYYYCHYSHDEDEALPMLAWAVSQACRQLSWVPQELRDLFDQGHDPRVHELQNVLATLLERLETFYLVIDAVDESAPRDELLCLVSALALDKRFAKVRILATSREYFDIQRVFGGVSTALSMSNASVDDDMRLFVRARLAASRRLLRWRDMFGEIEDVLVSKARGMFRWAECQIQSIERLRDMSELSPTLADLPLDISETYVRIFAAIPEADRGLMRQVLIWVVGHSRAPWISERGISAKMLLSAVAWDVHGPDVSWRYSSLDCEDLQELCGCLLTFRTDDECEIDDSTTGYMLEITEQMPLAPDLVGSPFGLELKPEKDSTELYVSIAHYTVLEFLASQHILETPVSCFALRHDTAETEFARSVLSQALAADPCGRGTDWIHDREAYCLTLGAALKTGGYLADAAVRGLYLRYMCPAGPHYARFRPLQAELVKGYDNSDSFYINSLPGAYLAPLTGEPRDHAAETLLNLLLVRHGRPIDGDMLAELAAERPVEALLGARVRVLVREAAFVGELAQGGSEVEGEGKVMELLSGRSLLAPSELRENMFLVFGADGADESTFTLAPSQVSEARWITEPDEATRFVRDHMGHSSWAARFGD